MTLFAALAAAMAACLVHPAAAQNRLAQPIVVALPDSGSYVVKRDIVYRERDGRTLLLDAFAPAEPAGSLVPTVVLVHGGPLPPSLAPQGKDLGQYQSFGPYLTGKGLGSVVFSHGFSDLTAFQSARADIEAAVAYVRKNARTLGFDPDRVCLVHISAGGTFLAPFLEARPPWLRCVVLYYPVLRPSTLEVLGAGSVPPDQEEGLDPFAYVTAAAVSPSLFMAEAGRDAPALNEVLRLFRDAATDAGWNVEYWNHPSGPHGFDVFDPSPRSRLILERTRAFLAEQLRAR